MQSAVPQLASVSTQPENLLRTSQQASSEFSILPREHTSRKDTVQKIGEPWRSERYRASHPNFGRTYNRTPAKIETGKLNSDVPVFQPQSNSNIRSSSYANYGKDHRESSVHFEDDRVVVEGIYANAQAKKIEAGGGTITNSSSSQAAKVGVVLLL